jgi:hypothetical protein
MLRFSRPLSSPLLVTGISLFAALPAAAQEQPPPAAPAEGGGVAPAEVKLEEEPAAEPAEPAKAPAAAPAAPPAAAPAEAAPAVTVGAETAVAAGEEAVVFGTDATPASHGGVDVGVGDWEFGYHGYMRAPMRIGIGVREDAQRIDPETRAISDNYSTTTFHLPLVPDDQYLSWQRTNHSYTDWAEMFFTVGNPYARGTMSVEGYNFTQGSWSEPETQFGVAQGYVEIMPELPYENVRLNWKVGSSWGKYGMAGRWDAGEYDTYLFGRTKGMGETIRAEIDVSEVTLAFEHGLLTKRPNPQWYNTARFTLMTHGHAFLEYGGLMGGLHFAHAWAQEEDRDGTGDANIPEVYTAQWGNTDPDDTTGGAWRLPDGSMSVMGGEIKYDTGPYGLGYLGFARMNAQRALVVAPAIEWLHAEGGGEFNMGVTNNYLDNPRCQGIMLRSDNLSCSSRGTGNVNALLFQYEFSVANLLQGLEKGTTFWGDGMDFKALVYAMYNQVSSEYDPNYDAYALSEAQALGYAAPRDNYSEHTKLKFGTDLTFSVFPAMAMALRFDRVQPNNNLPNQSFSILSPRLEFRSRWVTRESIHLQYSRYFYDQRECTPLHTAYDPADPQGGPAFAQGRAGVPTVWTGYPVTQDCAQYPSAPRLPEGWGAIEMNTREKHRGQPVAGGNPNAVRPDVNVITVAAEMWW